MLAVGVGVGIAAVLGILRLLNQWSIKTLIYVTLIPTIAFTCVLNWAIPDLQTIVGLAWDCGAVRRERLRVEGRSGAHPERERQRQRQREICWFYFVSILKTFRDCR